MIINLKDAKTVVIQPEVFGGVRSITPTSYPDFAGGEYYNVTHMAQPVFSAPQNITQDTLGSLLRVNTRCVAEVTVSAYLTFNELNAGRTLNARLSVGQEVIVTGFPVGRNTGGVSIGDLALPVQVDELLVGQPITLALGGGDDFSNVTVQRCALRVGYVGRLP